MAIPAPYQDWTAVHNPAAATQATVTQAPQAAQSSPSTPNFTPWLIINEISASIAAAGTAQTPIHAYLRDGATGTGTIVWSGILAAPANSSAGIHLSNLQIPIKSAVGATLEFEAAGVAASVQSVAMSGRNISYGGN